MKKLLIIPVVLLSFTTASAQRSDVEKVIKEHYKEEHGADGMAKLTDLMADMNNATTRPVYKFPMSMTMHVTQYDKGVKKDASDIKYHINTAEQTFAFLGSDNKGSGKEMMVVYDSKSGTMVMLDEKKKSYMAMNVNAFMSAEVQAHMNKDKKDNVKCTKTGKTKTIRGYVCQEYVCIDSEKDTKVEVWVTDKIQLNMAKAAEGQPWAAYFKGMDGLNGMMVEAKMYEKGKLEGTMEMTEINENANHVITLSNYKKTDMFGGR